MANDVTITFNGQPSSLLAAFSQINSASQETEAALNRVSGQGDENTSMLGRLGGAVSGILSPLQNFAGQLANVFETMTLWRIMDQVTGAIQDMTDAWFQLNDATQKNIYTWKYLLPGGMASAQSLASWTKSESLNIPYTRQDMLNAITTMAGLNLNMQQIQEYLPMLADLGATRAPDRNLASIANIVAGAEFGVTRMLRYDLHIDPKELAKYGYTEGKGADASKFLPALMAWSQAHGYQGAAKDIADNTFWGAWSSFLDRIQNFQLDFGAKGFGELQTMLVNLSAWIDNHSEDISHLAGIISGVLAGGLMQAASAAEQFFMAVSGGNVAGIAGGLGLITRSLAQDVGALGSGLFGGLNQTNAGASLADTFKVIGQALGNSQVQETLKEIGKTAGIVVGNGLQLLDTLVKDLAAGMAGGAGTQILQLGNGLLKVDQTLTTMVGTLAPLFAVLGPVFALLSLLGPVVQLAEGPFTGIVMVWRDLTTQGSALNTEANQVMGAFQSLGTAIGNFFKDLASKAATWGTDLINSLTGGIQTAWNATGGAVLNGIAGAFKKVLGHSKPESGPMADDDLWMTHMMQSFQTQILAGIPGVAQASMMVASAIGGPLTGQGGGGVAGSATYGGSYATTTSYGGNNTVIYGAGDGYIQQLMNHAIATASTQAVVKAKQPGGFRRPGPGGVIAF